MYELQLWPDVYVYELVLHTHCALRIWGCRDVEAFAQRLPAQLLCVATIHKSAGPGDDRVPHLWAAP